MAAAWRRKWHQQLAWRIGVAAISGYQLCIGWLAWRRISW
jgi:hypothetical protein